MSAQGVVHLDPVALPTLLARADDSTLRVVLALLAMGATEESDFDERRIIKAAHLTGGLKELRRVLDLLADANPTPPAILERRRTRAGTKMKLTALAPGLMVAHPATAPVRQTVRSERAARAPLISPSMANLRTASRNALTETAGERVTSLVDALLLRLVELDSGREMRLDAQITQYETALRLFRAYGADILSEALSAAMRKLTNTAAPEHYVEAACRGIYEDQHGGKARQGAAKAAAGRRHPDKPAEGAEGATPKPAEKPAQRRPRRTVPDL